MSFDYRTLPILPAELQQVIDTFHLSEREAAAQLHITRHEYRTRLHRAIKIAAPHAGCLVSNGEGI
jgi:hypothetical protein